MQYPHLVLSHLTQQKPVVSLLFRHKGTYSWGAPGFLPGQFIHALGTSPRKGDGEIEPEDEESVQGQMGAYAFLDSHT